MITDHTNPGTIDPSRQAYPAPAGPAAAPSTSALECSTGEVQVRAVGPSQAARLPGGLPSEVQVASQSCALPESSRRAPSTGLGLPAQVDACSQSAVRSSPPAVAASFPTAVSLPANTSLRSGLPKNVCIK